jgi:hypothetical protein
MEKKILYSVVVIVSILNSYLSAESISNPGFENIIEGDPFDTPANWGAENYVSSLSIFETSSSEYPGEKVNWEIDVQAGLQAYEGSKFVLLSNGPADIMYGKITQDVTVEEGDIITGAYFFGACDYTPFSDYAYIKLIPHFNQPEIVLLSITVDDVGNYGSTNGWVTFSSDPFNFSGICTLECAVYDGLDSVLDTYFAIDGLTIIPEPITILMFAAGFTFLKKK